MAQDILTKSSWLVIKLLELRTREILKQNFYEIVANT